MYNVYLKNTVMKKRYIAPALYCVKVSTSHLLAASILQSTSEGFYEEENAGSELGVKSNNYNFWDDNFWDDNYFE